MFHKNYTLQNWTFIISWAVTISPTCRHFPGCPLTKTVLHTSRGSPVVQTPGSGPFCGGTCVPGSMEPKHIVMLGVYILKIQKSIHVKIVFDSHVCVGMFCSYHCELCVQECFPHHAAGVHRNRAVRASPAIWAHTNSQRLMKKIK